MPNVGQASKKAAGLEPFWSTTDRETVRLYHGDVIAVLRQLPAKSVQCVVTSPPYWGLRDYGVGGQIGSERTPQEFVAKMVEVFREVHRVLRDDGTLFLNLGDTYSNSVKGADISPVDSAWLAALIDGEGCIRGSAIKKEDHADNFHISITVVMKDKQACEKAYRVAGCGVFKYLESRNMWSWVVRDREAENVLKYVYPYLVIKSRQASLAVELCRDLRERGCRYGNPATPEAVKYRRDLIEACSSCNQRSDNGFPAPTPPPPDRLGTSIPAGNLCGVPWRVALALQEDGWCLRQDIIWEKPSPMPESVRNRCTKSHEYVFLLTKGQRYFYDAEAIKEKALRAGDHPGGDYSNKEKTESQQSGGWIEKYGKVNYGESIVPDARNKRSVWTVSSQGYEGAHFATFPPKLIEPCILAGTSAKGACAVCGAPWRRLTEQKKLTRERPNDYVKRTGEEGTGNSCANSVAGVEVKTTGWEPTCTCHGAIVRRVQEDGEERMTYKPNPNTPLEDHPVRPCVVLDPFIGSGTSCVVSLEHGRWSWGIDLSAKYLRDNAVPRIVGALQARPALAHLAAARKAVQVKGIALD